LSKRIYSEEILVREVRLDKGIVVLDEKTIGLIEEAFNRALEQEDILDRTKWTRDEVVLKSQEDFVLGYILGSLMSAAYEIARIQKIDRLSKKRLEKELGKERAEEIQRRWKNGEGKVKPILLTEKEVNQIRDMLRRRISDFRRKIHQEHNR